jgi:hypothetical protein
MNFIYEEYVQFHKVFVGDMEIVNTTTVPNIVVLLNLVLLNFLDRHRWAEKGPIELFVRVRYVIINLYFIRMETASNFNLCSLMCGLRI